MAWSHRAPAWMVWTLAVAACAPRKAAAPGQDGGPDRGGGPGGGDGVAVTPGDPDLGWIDATLTFSDRINWPGLEEAGGRVIPLIQGFGNGRPAAYWFLGFASRDTADSFWFCREGDDLCPLDEHRRLGWDRLVGHPIFARIPGMEGFAPFWQMWKVTVPADYEPDEIKHPDTLHARREAGELTVEPFVLDFGSFFGEQVGPQEVVLHCALVLEGTSLEDNGGAMPDGSGRMLRLRTRRGWFEGYRVDFIDFSPSDGAFPEAIDSENRPKMRFADIFILWRDCEADPRPAICDLPGHAYSDRRPVSERGLGQDITGDGDDNDTSNVLGALPCELANPADRPYSPLWGPLEVRVVKEFNTAIPLIDTTGDQTESALTSSDEIRECVERGECTEPAEMTEDEIGNPIPGNDGRIFFHCPTPVRANFLPSCRDRPPGPPRTRPPQIGDRTDAGAAPGFAPGARAGTAAPPAAGAGGDCALRSHRSPMGSSGGHRHPGPPGDGRAIGGDDPARPGRG